MYISTLAPFRRFLSCFPRLLSGCFWTERLPILAAQSHRLFVERIVGKCSVDFLPPRNGWLGHSLKLLLQPSDFSFQRCDALFNLRYSHKLDPPSVVPY